MLPLFPMGRSKDSSIQPDDDDRKRARKYKIRNELRVLGLEIIRRRDVCTKERIAFVEVMKKSCFCRRVDDASSGWGLVRRLPTCAKSPRGSVYYRKE
jgi:hypothetical protein